MKNSFRILTAATLFALITLAGCGSGGGGGADSTAQSETSATADFAANVVAKDAAENEVKTVCGAVIDNQLYKPIPLDRLEPVLVQPLRADLAIINRLQGPYAGLPQVVKLHGVSSDGLSPFQNQKGMDLINLASTPNGYFVSAGDNCITTLPDGTLALVGQLISSDLYVVSEFSRYFNTVLPTPDICGGEQLNACITSIQPKVEISPISINIFLWKPASDGDGTLVILVGPYDITVVVNGEVGASSGPSNGYGSTARFPKPGCAYGAAKVEFFDSLGRQVLTDSGLASEIGGGCARKKVKY